MMSANASCERPCGLASTAAAGRGVADGNITVVDTVLDATVAVQPSEEKLEAATTLLRAAEM